MVSYGHGEGTAEEAGDEESEFHLSSFRRKRRKERERDREDRENELIRSV